MKTLLMTTAAALFVAGTAYAADVKVLIDADEDGQVTVEEWNSARGEMDVFGAWDANDDDMMSQEEYAAGVEMSDDPDTFGTWEETYAGWDEDSDGMLSANEYNTGLWTAFDADADGMMSAEEVETYQADPMNYDAVRSGADVSQ